MGSIKPTEFLITGELHGISGANMMHLNKVFESSTKCFAFFDFNIYFKSLVV